MKSLRLCTIMFIWMLIFCNAYYWGRYFNFPSTPNKMVFPIGLNQLIDWLLFATSSKSLSCELFIRPINHNRMSNLFPDHVKENLFVLKHDLLISRQNVCPESAWLRFISSWKLIIVLRKVILLSFNCCIIMLKIIFFFLIIW